MLEPHAGRRDQLRGRLGAADLPAVLVTRLVNVGYLTGFTGSNGALLLTAAGGDVLAVDGRYRTQAEVQAPDLELVVDRAVAPALAARAAHDGVRRLGFEAHDVTVELHATLTEAAAGGELVPAGRLVEDLRASKDEAEVALIRVACGIVDRAFADWLSLVAAGRSERELAADLEARLWAHGADGPGFATICATGPNTAVPHHRPTDRVLAPGELLKVDFGARHAGYHSDMTRTLALGPVADWQREIHDLVATAQRAGRETLAVGLDCRTVDEVVRELVELAGYGEQYPHGLGHGIGLEVHEAPIMGYGQTGRLLDRTTLTVEPGVYLPGWGGVRIEDTLVLRERGPESLTTTTRELLVL